MYPDKQLREHALNAVAVESGRGWRLATGEGKATRKIDAVVALSFAALAAVERGAWQKVESINQNELHPSLRSYFANPESGRPGGDRPFRDRHGREHGHPDHAQWARRNFCAECAREWEQTSGEPVAVPNPWPL